MTRSLRLCAIALLAAAGAFGGEAFRIILPDQPNQQLLNLSVRTTAGAVYIEQDEPLKLPFAPASLALRPDGKRLIASGNGKGKTSAATVEILGGGALRSIASSALDHPAGYTSIDRTGRFFMSAHYGSGTIAAYPIAATGEIGHATSVLKTPKHEAHCILTTPDNRFAYIPCVKTNNALYQYSFDEKTGTLAPLEPHDARPPAMYGPRHVAYHPELPIAYFSNEQQLGVSVYQIGNDGQLADLQHAATLPRRSPYESGKRDLHASDLVLSPDGKFLFVAVRDFVGDEDSVFTFRIEADGKLSLSARAKVGDIPWRLGISPDGTLLVVGETGDNRLGIYAIQSDGTLTPAESLPGTSPRDMVVLPIR